MEVCVHLFELVNPETNRLDSIADDLVEGGLHHNGRLLLYLYETLQKAELILHQRHLVSQRLVVRVPLCLRVQELELLFKRKQLRLQLKSVLRFLVLERILDNVFTVVHALEYELHLAVDFAVLVLTKHFSFFALLLRFFNQSVFLHHSLLHLLFSGQLQIRLVIVERLSLEQDDPLHYS